MPRKIIFIFLLLLSISFYTMAPKSMDVSVMAFLLGLIAFSLVLFFTRKEPVFLLKGQFLKHSNLIIFGFLIVHFQLYIDYVLGNISKDDSFIWVNEIIVIKSMVLSFIGLLSFFLGFLFYQRKSLKIKKYVVLKGNKTISTKFLTYLATITLAVYFYTVNPLYLLGFYGSEAMGSTATYMAFLFNILTFPIIIQNCRNLRIQGEIPANFFQYSKFMGAHLLFLLCLYLLSVVISGDRGPLITYALCYGSGYFFVKRTKLSYRNGILILFVGALMISILGLVRNLNKNLTFIEKVELAFSSKGNSNETSFLNVTRELSGSVRTVHHSVNHVPLKHDFMYGRFQFQAITSAIPFFSIFSPIIYDDLSSKYSGSSSFVTWIIQGNFPTSGAGSSCIADFYLDFGLFGVLIGMFFFGYFMRMSEVKFYSANMPTLFQHVFILVYLSNAIYVSRSAVLFGFKNIVLIFVLLIVNKYIFNKLSSRL